TSTRREDQKVNLPRQREQPPPPSSRRKSCDVRRDARVRKRIRLSDRQEQPSPSSSPPRERIPSARREERLHTITPSSRGHYKVWRRQDHREEARRCKHHTKSQPTTIRYQSRETLRSTRRNKMRSLGGDKTGNERDRDEIERGSHDKNSRQRRRHSQSRQRRL